MGFIVVYSMIELQNLCIIKYVCKKCSYTFNGINSVGMPENLVPRFHA